MKTITSLLALCLLARSLSAQTAKQNQARRAEENPQSAVGGVLVSPLLQRVICQPGRKAELVFVTENPGQVREVAQLELVSFTTEDWTYRTLYGTQHPRDCASWFGNPPRQISLQPGVRQELRLPLEIPRGTDGAYWCMLKFTPQPNGSTTKSLVVYEIPVVIIVGKNPKPVVKIGSPVLRRVDSKSRNTAMSAVIPLENESDGFSVLGAIGSLRNRSTNRVVAEFRVEDRNLMPRTKRELTFVIPSVSDGKYTLEFRPILGVRALPAVTSEIVVSKGETSLASEAKTRETTPITAEPSSLNLTIPAGGQRTGVVKITNNSNREIGLDINPVSVDQASNGAIGLGQGVLPGGLTVEVSGELSRVAPGQSTLARVKIAVPKDAKGDLWFALSVREAGNGNALADAFFGTISIPKTAKPGLSVEAPVEIRDGSKTVALKFQVRNSGNVAVRPEATATVLADGIRLVERLDVPVLGDGGLLPGKSIQNSVMLPPGLKPGSYVVEIAYQYGMQDFGRLRIPVIVPQKVVPKATKRKP